MVLCDMTYNFSMQLKLSGEKNSHDGWFPLIQAISEKKIMATLAFSYKITAKIKLNSMIPSKSLCALITKVDNNYKNKSRRQCKFNILPCRVPGEGSLRILDIHDYQMPCKYRRVTGQLSQEKCSFVYIENRKLKKSGEA